MLRRRKEHQFWICADAWFERLLHRVVPCQRLPTNLLSPNYVSPDSRDAHRQFDILRVGDRHISLFGRADTGYVVRTPMSVIGNDQRAHA